ncbi:MAG: chemotaxis response regulator protein-glutamate methylesterase [Planctomycetaceae bacterium]|nr:chemotaxis response regulator protein-glutamate methylesterase [Planctomycetaceae bacterium]
MKTVTRVLVVDDSVIVRGLLTRALESDPFIRVTGTAMHGEAALVWLEKNTADVVILDVEMPVMDGLTTLEILRKEFPSVRVIMASTMTQTGAETSVKALSLGAASCIAKPVTSSMAESIRQLSTELLPQVRALGPADPSDETAAGILLSLALNRAGGEDGMVAPAPLRRRTRPQVLVIGASTGGPQALTEVLTSLPQDFPLPIFVVQHMPAQFTRILANRLDSMTGRPCREAADGMLITPGETLIAPGGYHMETEYRSRRLVTAVHSGPAEHFCRPSINPLFRSVSRNYGSSVLAVMLTGMGDDGIEGAHEVFENGGTIIAQDRHTSVVWGMPGAVVRAGLAHFILPLNQIAPEIKRICALEACTHDA